MADRTGTGVQEYTFYSYHKSGWPMQPSAETCREVQTRTNMPSGFPYNSAPAPSGMRLAALAGLSLPLAALQGSAPLLARSSMIPLWGSQRAPSVRRRQQ